MCDKPLLFVRIPRTSSTAIFQALARLIGSELSTSDLGTARAGLDGFDLIHGHLVLDDTLWPQIDCRAHTMTVLREPIDRVTSLYYRFRLDPGYAYHRELQTMSLADFVRSGQRAQTYQANNDMVRRLSGVEFDFGEDCWCAVDAALRNLESFDVVGVYGWQGALRGALARLGLELPALDRVSVSRERVTTGMLEPADLEAVQEYNRLDFALYSAATERVAEELYRQAQGNEKAPRGAGLED